MRNMVISGISMPCPCCRVTQDRPNSLGQRCVVLARSSLLTPMHSATNRPHQQRPTLSHSTSSGTVHVNARKHSTNNTLRNVQNHRRTPWHWYCALWLRQKSTPRLLSRRHTCVELPTRRTLIWGTAYRFATCRTCRGSSAHPHNDEYLIASHSIRNPEKN